MTPPHLPANGLASAAAPSLSPGPSLFSAVHTSPRSPAPARSRRPRQLRAPSPPGPLLSAPVRPAGPSLLLPSPVVGLSNPSLTPTPAAALSPGRSRSPGTSTPALAGAISPIPGAPSPPSGPNLCRTDKQLRLNQTFLPLLALGGGPANGMITRLPSRWACVHYSANPLEKGVALSALSSTSAMTTVHGTGPAGPQTYTER